MLDVFSHVFSVFSEGEGSEGKVEGNLLFSCTVCYIMRRRSSISRVA